MRAGSGGRHRLRRRRAGKMIGTGIAGAAIVLTGQAVYLGPTSAYFSDTVEVGPFGFVYQAPGTAAGPNQLAAAADAGSGTAGEGPRRSAAPGSAGTDSGPGTRAGAGSDGVGTEQPQSPRPSQPSQPARPPVSPSQPQAPPPSAPQQPEPARRTLSIVETVGEVVEPVTGPVLAAVDGAVGG